MALLLPNFRTPDPGLWRLWHFDESERRGGGTRPTGIPVSVGPVPSPGVFRIFHGVRSPESASHTRQRSGCRAEPRPPGRGQRQPSSALTPRPTGNGVRPSAPIIRGYPVLVPSSSLPITFTLSYFRSKPKSRFWIFRGFHIGCGATSRTGTAGGRWFEEAGGFPEGNLQPFPLQSPDNIVLLPIRHQHFAN